ncbi:MAG: diguanylate cyclase, partial [Oscillospiraceae bacterium]|nr:diguanylate cyclase [Oscillospiraceae bacterium]
MFRSLHMKLVMILVLLITSLMTVVGAFLMTSVTSFYIDSFYKQMNEAFSDAAFYSALQTEAAQADGAQRLQSLMELYAGTLGIDSRSRNYYILDADTGAFLAGSDEAGGETLEQTVNI